MSTRGNRVCPDVLVEGDLVVPTRPLHVLVQQRGQNVCDLHVLVIRDEAGRAVYVESSSSLSDGLRTL